MAPKMVWTIKDFPRLFSYTYSEEGSHSAFLSNCFNVNKDTGVVTSLILKTSLNGDVFPAFKTVKETKEYIEEQWQIYILRNL